MVPSEAPAGISSSPGWRVRLSVTLLGVLAAAWIVVGFRLYVWPAPGGVNPAISALLGLGAILNAIVLGFAAWWVWRGARWAIALAGASLLVDGLLIIQPQMDSLERTVLWVTLAAGTVVLSVLVRPEPLTVRLQYW